MKILLKMLILMSISFTIIFGQQEFSIHKMHKDVYGIKDETPSLRKSEGEIIPLMKRQSKLNRVVFGYLPDWEYIAGNHQYFDYDLLTHIACFDFTVAENGNISNPSRWPWTELINKAHSNGVKTVLTAVNFDEDEIRSIITNSSSKTNFFSKIKGLVQQYSFNGVNIDFEGLYYADRGAPIVDFMKELTEYVHAFDAECEVSFAGPAVNWGTRWDLTGLANACDYVFIMGYAYYGKWSTNTGPNAPFVGTSQNISKSVTTYYGEIVNSNPEKIILGLPYYGLQWKTDSQNPYTSVVKEDYVKSPRYKEAIVAAETHGRKWDSKSQTPYITWQTDRWNQVWYDDTSSLALKYDFAISKNLRGIGMWAFFGL